MLIFAIADEAARADVEGALDVQFKPHYSLYLGDYWRAELPDSEGFLRIRWNRDPLWQPHDPDEERFAFPEYRQHQLLLEAQDESIEVAEKLRQVAVLQFLGDGRRPRSG